MEHRAAGIAGPVSQTDRIIEMDMLRGFALMGVLLMNFVGMARPGGMFMTSEQGAALATAPLDNIVQLVLLVLFMDKANTMFATLFGLGFYLQMKRGQGIKGFEARYRRRLFWLLVMGFINLTLIWVWDILFLYALTGFIFLLMRNWKTRSLVIFGLIAACYREKLQNLIVGLFATVPDPEWLFTDEMKLARQEIVRFGNYPDVVAMMWQLTWYEFIATGMIVGWVVYALGRFALGAALGRSGILEDIPSRLPLLCKVAMIAIPAGIALSSLELALMLGAFGENAEDFGDLLAPFAALVTAGGYAAGLVLAWHAGWPQRILRLFVPVGQMALTNYLMQALAYGFILFGMGIGPFSGLGLIGHIGITAVLGVCIVFFAMQIAFSHIWLARFRFGPMEWLWRTLTYGKRPQMRREIEMPMPA